MIVLAHAVTVVIALRWVLVSLGFLVLGALYADAVMTRRQQRAAIAKLEHSNRVLVAHHQTRRTRRPIVAGPVIP